MQATQIIENHLKLYDPGPRKLFLLKFKERITNEPKKLLTNFLGRTLFVKKPAYKLSTENMPIKL